MISTEQIKELIANNKTQHAIDQLKELTKDTQLHNEVIQQSAKLNQYETDKRAGTHSNEALSRHLNQINQALLSIIEQIEHPDKLSLKEQSETGRGKNKSLWQYITAAAVIIGILGSLAEIFNLINIIPGNKNGTTHTVTVLAHSKKGKDDPVLPNRGIVYLMYGDAKIPEQVNNKGLAVFNQIPDRFFDPEARVEIFFEDPKDEPYRVANRDTFYDLKYQTYIPILVVLEGMEQIQGKVEDFKTGEAIDSVAIRKPFGKAVYTDENGEFTLDIPEEIQEQHITLIATKKGYQKWEKSEIPTTTEKIITIPLKKE